MKKIFSEPEIEVIAFAVEDVITKSGNSSLDEDELPPIVVG